MKVMMKEFTKQIGPYNMDMVVLFNEDYVSEELVDKCIKDGSVEHRMDMAVMFKAQYEILCR